MDIEIVELPEIRLVGLQVVGRRSELAHRVPLAWIELEQRLRAIPGAVPDRFYGVFREADHLAADRDPTYVYLTCVQSDADTPAGMVEIMLPARTYATATVRGGSEAIDATYTALARFLEGHADADAHGFERYEATRQAVTPPYAHFDYDVFRAYSPAPRP